MGFWGRWLESLTGRSKSRLPRQLQLLGAPPDLVERARHVDEEQQEALFVRFIDHKHGCVLDWRATREDVFAALQPLLTPQEARLIPPRSDAPADKNEAIHAIGIALAGSARRIVHTESLGDSSILLLVPSEQLDAFLKAVGPWQIQAT